jgi:hypothetical protein
MDGKHVNVKGGFKVVVPLDARRQATRDIATATVVHAPIQNYSYTLGQTENYYGPLTHMVSGFHYFDTVDVGACSAVAYWMRPELRDYARVYVVAAAGNIEASVHVPEATTSSMTVVGPLELFTGTIETRDGRVTYRNGVMVHREYFRR